MFPELRERVQHVPSSDDVLHQDLKLDRTLEFLQDPKPYSAGAAVAELEDCSNIQFVIWFETHTQKSSLNLFTTGLQILMTHHTKLQQLVQLK